MPQLTLNPHDPSAMRDLRILVRPPKAPNWATEVIVSVEQGRHDTPFPVWVGSLPGLESDCLVTLVTEALTSWAYGERIRDVQVACAAVKKQAVVHAARHEF